MDVMMTSLSLEDEGHKKKEKKRETKSEKRRRKKKQMSTDALKESSHDEEGSKGIAGTVSKPSEDGDEQDDDIPVKDYSSQESLKPSIETPVDRSEKTNRAVE